MDATNLENLSDYALLEVWESAKAIPILGALVTACSAEAYKRAEKPLKEVISYLLSKGGTIELSHTIPRITYMQIPNKKKKVFTTLRISPSFSHWEYIGVQVTNMAIPETQSFIISPSSYTIEEVLETFFMSAWDTDSSNSSDDDLLASWKGGYVPYGKWIDKF